MATRFDTSQITAARDALQHRIALAREEGPEGIAGPPWRRMLGELDWVLEPFRRIGRKQSAIAARHPRTVMLLPGFATHPVRMRYMARGLEAAGHRVKRWGLGFNWGSTEDNLELLDARPSIAAEKRRANDDARIDLARLQRRLQIRARREALASNGGCRRPDRSNPDCGRCLR